MSDISVFLDDNLVYHLIVILIPDLTHLFMLGLLMASQISRPFCFVVTLITAVAYSFMLGIFMVFQIVLLCCFVVTLITAVTHSFMFGLLMGFQMSLLCCLVVTLIAAISYAFMNGSLVMQQSTTKISQNILGLIVKLYQLYITNLKKKTLVSCRNIHAAHAINTAPGLHKVPAVHAEIIIVELLGCL